MPSRSRTSSARAGASPSKALEIISGKATFSRTVSEGIKLKNWNTMPIFRRRSSVVSRSLV